MNCLPRGIEIVQGQASNLRGTIPTPVNIFCDSAQRDINTSLAIIAGLGDPNIPLVVDYDIFNPGMVRRFNSYICYSFLQFSILVFVNHTVLPVAGSICPAMPTYLQDQALEQRWNQVCESVVFFSLQESICNNHNNLIIL